MRYNCTLSGKSVFLRAMLKSGNYLLLILSLLVLVTACDSYNKVLKSNDLEYKLTKAKEYYNSGNYYKALPLFEELISAYRGKPELEEIYYFYSYSYYGQENYLLAAYNFKNFVSAFPVSKYAEEAQYMHAMSFYMISPVPKLDQTNTLKAIDAFQLFITKYPGSTRVAEANKAISELRRKMELKAFQSAQLYYDMDQYKAAAIAFENILRDYPDTPEAELVNFLKFKSYYNYARNSIDARKLERYNEAIVAYNDFKELYPESRYSKEAENLYITSKAAIQNLSSND